MPKLTKIKKEYKGKKGGGVGGKESRELMAVSPASLQEKFICTTCERVYKNKDSLGRHLKWECGKEPSFACSRCPYKARYKADLVRHEKTRHLKREPGDCSLLCAATMLDAWPWASGWPWPLAGLWARRAGSACHRTNPLICHIVPRLSYCIASLSIFTSIPGVCQFGKLQLTMTSTFLLTIFIYFFCWCCNY